MNEYTVFALDIGSEQLGDALVVSGEHLGAAVKALIEYWASEQEKVDDEAGAYCEVYQGSTRDGHDWKALPWQPGDPVIDAEAEAQRKYRCSEVGILEWAIDKGFFDRKPQE